MRLGDVRLGDVRSRDGDGTDLRGVACGAMSADDDARRTDDARASISATPGAAGRTTRDLRSPLSKTPPTRRALTGDNQVSEMCTLGDARPVRRFAVRLTSVRLYCSRTTCYLLSYILSYLRWDSPTQGYRLGSP